MGGRECTRRVKETRESRTDIYALHKSKQDKCRRDLMGTVDLGFPLVSLFLPGALFGSLFW